jgi:hypothetical protein
MATISGPALFSIALLMLMGISWTNTAYIVPCAILAMVLLLNPRFIVLAALGGIITGAVCLVETNLCFVLWPDFLLFWKAGTFWTQLILGIPLGDVVFAVVMGASHPAILAYAAGARVGKDEAGRPGLKPLASSG